MAISATPSGSDQSKNRSLGGILVHVLALFTSFVGPAIVYAASNHEFTRENARNAINWHIIVQVLWAVSFVLSLTMSLPSPFDTAFGLIGLPVLLAFAVLGSATFVFAIVATWKAASGSAWSYPGTINIIDRLR
ncbi:DUF4870 domain-containing protein [Natronococcus sp. A-GB1]|uniref:DUF4870 domain-containing protein n=1 Tax=Natronococcus sp. A-GB1 TaxID=3037648 RepID=UPI00241D6319|nr:DUF4870 domain-containing protein [Natronococcus sp. A-GB1]MDG5758566.1 DUF4870 domain-containing protein [Natronococcus sp. A-GB1]